MADKNHQTGEAEQENLSQLLQIRRDKLLSLIHISEPTRPY